MKHIQVSVTHDFLQFSVADPQPASQHPDSTMFLAFSLFLMQKAVGFGVFFKVNLGKSDLLLPLESISQS